MKWVTWQNVGVDRIGCAWLIRRFIDAKASFSFIPEGDKPPQKAGEPFDNGCVGKSPILSFGR